jgi:large subunit ribosomal protein L25
MKRLSLKAEKRNVFGRKVKKLRTQGLLPASLYGKKLKSLALQLSTKDFLAVYKQAGETSLVDLAIAKEEQPHAILIRNLQRHPVSSDLLHVDFRQVDLKEKVQVAIPIEVIGQAPGVTKGGVLVQVMNEINVEALPTDLPDKFTVDVSKLEEIGQSLSVKNLKHDKEKVKLLVEDETQLVVKVEEPAKEEVEEKPAEVVPAEGEVAAPAEGEAKPAEGKPTEGKPAEGKKPAAAPTAKPEAKKSEAKK